MPTKKQIKKALTGSRIKRDPPATDADFLSSGITLLDLSITGQVGRGIRKGQYLFFVGDSSSGKTFVVLTLLAEAAKNPSFDKYQFIYNDVEGGALMDLKKYFGARMADRLVVERSATIEQFYDDITDRKPPFIYILDSMDGLSSVYEGLKFQEGKRARAGGPKAKGDFGDGKAKKNSSGIRQVLPKLRDTGSILIVICQTRDNVNKEFYEPDKTRAGGHALRFYSHVEVWTSIQSKIKAEVKGLKLQTGIIARADVQKNRVSGKEWPVSFPIYFSTGVDDIGANVDFLVKTKHWKKNDTGIITAADFVGFSGRREPLIKKLQENNLDEDVRDIVAEVWAEVEAACAIQRKSRYE